MRVSAGVQNLFIPISLKVFKQKFQPFSRVQRDIHGRIFFPFAWDIRERHLNDAPWGGIVIKMMNALFRESLPKEYQSPPRKRGGPHFKRFTAVMNA